MAYQWDSLVNAARETSALWPVLSHIATEGVSIETGTPFYLFLRQHVDSVNQPKIIMLINYRLIEGGFQSFSPKVKKWLTDLTAEQPDAFLSHGLVQPLAQVLWQEVQNLNYPASLIEESVFSSARSMDKFYLIHQVVATFTPGEIIMAFRHLQEAGVITSAQLASHFRFRLTNFLGMLNGENRTGMQEVVHNFLLSVFSISPRMELPHGNSEPAIQRPRFLSPVVPGLDKIDTVRLNMAQHYQFLSHLQPHLSASPTLPLPKWNEALTKFNDEFYQDVLTQASRKQLDVILFIDGDQLVETDLISLFSLSTKKNCHFRVYIFMNSFTYQECDLYRRLPTWLNIVLAPMKAKDAADVSLCFLAGELQSDLRRIELQTGHSVDFLLMTGDKFSYSLVETLRNKGRRVGLIQPEESLVLVLLHSLNRGLSVLGQEIRSGLVLPALSEVEITTDMTIKRHVLAWYQTHYFSLLSHLSVDGFKLMQGLNSK